MRLGQFFTLEELTRTSTGLQNIPGTQELINLTRMVTLVLDPIRLEVGRLTVSSGFRSEAVNGAVGGVDDSFHLLGCGADLQGEMSTEELFDLIQLNFEHSSRHIDKVILENIGGKSWVHIQTQPIGGENRNMYMVATDVKETNGSVVYLEV